MSPKRLVLFDIDGTLLWGGPMWKECFLGALKSFYPEYELPSVSFGGKTDIQICRELMRESGYNTAEIDENMRKVVDEYTRRATEQIATRKKEAQLLPGVREVLEYLHQHSDVLLGLLTGNVARGAQLKLSLFELEKFFKFGVYGDDHADRYKLPALAQKRARELFGHEFEGKQIVIIGDTVHDVNCGKSIGVRTIAVGTGKSINKAELLSHDPDYYFADLSATYEVINAILEDV